MDGTRAPGQESDHEDRDPVTVLVVDDQPRFLAVAETVVRRTAGFTIVGTAADGAEAVQRAAALRPALVLMDINMPVLDGIAACRQITALPAPPAVILLSTYHRDDLPDGFNGSGAAAYLHKEELDPGSLVAAWRGRSTRGDAPS